MILYYLIKEKIVDNNHGGIYISRLALLSKCNKNSKFWIVNINPKYISQVVSNNVFGALKEKSRNISKFKPKDIIILNTKIDGKLSFIGVSMVDDIKVSDEKLFNHYLSKKKVFLKSIKFFENPVKYNPIKDKIGVKNLSRKEFAEITEEDIKVIMAKETIIKTKPVSLFTLKFNLDDFILNTIISTHDIIANESNNKMISLKKFIKNIHNTLQVHGVNKNIKEIEEYYSHNAWKLNYKHVPSRTSEDNMKLYDAHGKSKNFGFVVLKK